MLRPMAIQSGSAGCPASPRVSVTAIAPAKPVTMPAMPSAFGRLSRHERNEPRVLDLDVIAAGTLTGTFGALEVPHARAHQRPFVLLPMAELAPDFVLPGQTKTVAQLLDGLDLEGCEKLG